MVKLQNKKNKKNAQAFQMSFLLLLKAINFGLVMSPIFNHSLYCLTFGIGGNTKLITIYKFIEHLQ